MLSCVRQIIKVRHEDGKRKIFVYVTSGDLIVNGENLHEKDQTRIHSESNINIKANSDSDFILIDVNG